MDLELFLRPTAVLRQATACQLIDYGSLSIHVEQRFPWFLLAGAGPLTHTAAHCVLLADTMSAF